ncbi:GPP34 family phosphoprotein [Blastococcus sp. Marseille-P5729]|uniref:GOLPH3/VPS74 family protein n=1 Tax=Blastococcus sp. Marseille-P5729 TaxID=2086582 RepID=UPI000D0E9E08|nr:GPP34 family phosphoprotein [Blastococcus sp. Marseille-P5729]
MSLPLTQELLLIALDDESGKKHKSDTIDYGLAGAVVAELALLGRVDLTDGQVTVVDPSPTGDPVIDELLAAAGEKRRKTKSFVTKYGRKMSAKVAEQLIDAGIVTEGRRHFFGIIPSSRHHPTQASPEREIRTRLNAVVLQQMPADPRTAALVALIEATELHKQAFPDADKRDVKERMKAIAASDASGRAVRKAIDDVRSAIITAVTVSAVATTTSSGSP